MADNTKANNTKNKVFDIFCEKCGNILDITRSIPENVETYDANTPDVLSSDSDQDDDQDNDQDDQDDNQDDQDDKQKGKHEKEQKDGEDDDDEEPDGGKKNNKMEGNLNVDYETLLKKIEEGGKPTNDELREINIKDMVKNEYYKKMAKKGKIKKSITDMIDDLGNADENTNAFMVCNNCNYNKHIDPGFRVLSKNPENYIAQNDFVNEDAYRNKVHIRTMPSTRVFNCSNAKCPSKQKNVQSEAIFFRKNPNTHETVYVCKRCLTIKMN